MWCVLAGQSNFFLPRTIPAHLDPSVALLPWAWPSPVSLFYISTHLHLHTLISPLSSLHYISYYRYFYSTSPVNLSYRSREKIKPFGKEKEQQYYTLHCEEIWTSWISMTFPTIPSFPKSNLHLQSLIYISRPLNSTSPVTLLYLQVSLF